MNNPCISCSERHVLGCTCHKSLQWYMNKKKKEVKNAISQKKFVI